MENRVIHEKLHWGVFACGAALLALVAVGAARGWNSTGLWILVIAGIVCLLMALVAHRIARLTVQHGGTKIGIELVAEVREDLKVTGLAGAASIYSFIHNQLGKDPDLSAVKIKLQDQVVEMVQSNAFSKPIDQDQVDEVLRTGSPAERVLVFGLLQRDHTLATVERLHKGITQSKSGNEQYHALVATWQNWRTFSEDDRHQLRDFVRTASYIDEDPDRMAVVDKILAPLGSPAPAQEPAKPQGD